MDYADYKSSKQAREERAKIINKMNEKSGEVNSREDKKWKPEEIEAFNKMDQDQKTLLDRAQDLERSEKAEELKYSLDNPKIEEPKYGGYQSKAMSRQDNHNALKAWLSYNTPGCRSEWVEAAHKAGINLHSPTFSLTRGSSGVAQSVGTASAGGNTVADEMMGELDKALLAYGSMREAARVIRTATGADLPIPHSNDTMEKGQIVNENAENEVQSIAVGQTVLKSYKYTSNMVKVSLELLQDSGINLPQFVGEALGTRIGRILTDHFTVSASTDYTSSGNPQGLATVATASTATTASKDSITFTELLNFLHSVDPEYRNKPNSGFMFNDSTLRTIKSMTDTQNRPLWLPGVAVGEPDTILGYKYWINQSMPDQDADARFALFGDFSKYIVRDVMDVQLQRLNERYAEYGQVAFLALSRHDGRYINAGTNPIKVLVSGSST